MGLICVSKSGLVFAIEEAEVVWLSELPLRALTCARPHILRPRVKVSTIIRRTVRTSRCYTPERLGTTFLALVGSRGTRKVTGKNYREKLLTFAIQLKYRAPVFR